MVRTPFTEAFDWPYYVDVIMHGTGWADMWWQKTETHEAMLEIIEIAEDSYPTIFNPLQFAYCTMQINIQAQAEIRSEPYRLVVRNMLEDKIKSVDDLGGACEMLYDAVLNRRHSSGSAGSYRLASWTVCRALRRHLHAQWPIEWVYDSRNLRRDNL